MKESEGREENTGELMTRVKQTDLSRHSSAYILTLLCILLIATVQFDIFLICHLPPRNPHPRIPTQASTLPNITRPIHPSITPVRLSSLSTSTMPPTPPTPPLRTPLRKVQNLTRANPDPIPKMQQSSSSSSADMYHPYSSGTAFWPFRLMGTVVVVYDGWCPRWTVKLNLNGIRSVSLRPEPKTNRGVQVIGVRLSRAFSGCDVSFRSRQDEICLARRWFPIWTP